MAGLYIHIPFCRSRCIYCDFFSTTRGREWQMPYIAALDGEMTLRTAASPCQSPQEGYTLAEGAEFSTLYLGGGTPSQLTAEALQALFQAIGRHFRLSADAEITLEANPDDITPEWISALRATPVNRISMGVQSLNDDILRTLHRRHTAQQARHAVQLLRDAGYTNISLDLIYGLPGQTLELFTSDVRQLLSLSLPHLSAYALQYEPGTQLYRLREKGIISEADEELSLACYQRLIDLTHEAGFIHYEISNFALPGFHARHNSSYWTGQPYIGLGAGAHSYDGHSLRSYNCEHLAQYISAIAEGRLPSTSEQLSPTDRFNERVMLSLRTRQGLSLTALERDFGPQRRHYCEQMAQPHLRRGTMIREEKQTGETLRLTRQGLFVSNDIISDMLLA